MRWGLIVWALVALGFGERADAAGETIALSGMGQCPNATAVRIAIEKRHPGINFVTGSAKGARLLQFTDDGAHYRIDVGGAVHSYYDPARRCDARARDIARFMDKVDDTRVEHRRAQEVTARDFAAFHTKAGYPRALADRPLTLPRFLVQPTFSFDMTKQSGTDLGLALSAGVDVGITSRIQLGMWLAAPVAPRANFGTLIANGQVGLHRLFNLRVDVGFERNVQTTTTDTLENSLTTTTKMFIGGIGLPFKWKFHRLLALTSGSPRAMDFGSPFSSGTSSNFLYSGPIANAQNIFAISTDGKTTIGSVLIPVGLLVQPASVIALNLRTGYRFVFVEPQAGAKMSAHYIPLAADLIVSAVRRWDIGFTFDIAGIVATSSSVSGTQFATRSDYGSTWTMRLWVGARF